MCHIMSQHSQQIILRLDEILDKLKVWVVPIVIILLSLPTDWGTYFGTRHIVFSWLHLLRYDEPSSCDLDSPSTNVWGILRRLETEMDTEIVFRVPRYRTFWKPQNHPTPWKIRKINGVTGESGTPDKQVHLTWQKRRKWVDCVWNLDPDSETLTKTKHIGFPSMVNPMYFSLAKRLCRNFIYIPIASIAFWPAWISHLPGVRKAHVPA